MTDLLDLTQFNQAVRVRSIVLMSKDAARAPKNIKLFINRPSLGFEDVEDANEPAAAQVLELSNEDVVEGRPVVLRFVRFQSVNSLHVRSTDASLIYALLRSGNRSLYSQTMEAKKNHDLIFWMFWASL